MRNRLFVLIALAIPFFFSCTEGDIEAADLIACGVFDTSTHFCDSRDGRLYKFTKKTPDSKIWMAENLNFEPSDGESMCYNDKQENCNMYGRLYSWNERDVICPNGWRMPNGVDWQLLEDEASDDELKARNGWDAYDGKSGNGQDGFGFAALPGGAYRANYHADKDFFEDDCSDEVFSEWGSLGKIAVFMDASTKYSFIISNDPKLRYCVSMDALVSVRCIKE